MSAIQLPAGGRTRLAPTPSGYLHAGNAFNFLITERIARISGSRVILRIDDLDVDRSRPHFIEDIFRSLEWLGIRVDEGPCGPEELERSWSQAYRMVKYLLMLEELISTNVLYACRCSRTKLNEMAGNGLAHACREVNSLVTWAGNEPLRLRIQDPSPVRILDLNGRAQDHDLFQLMMDPVIRQRNTGRPAYQIASLSDDLEMGVTFIVRGEDLLPSTICQAHLAACLRAEGFRSVRFVHHPLITGSDGGKLSKSAGSASLRAMRLAGESPQSMIDAAARFVDELFSPSAP